MVVDSHSVDYERIGCAVQYLAEGKGYDELPFGLRIGRRDIGTARHCVQSGHRSVSRKGRHSAIQFDLANIRGYVSRQLAEGYLVGQTIITVQVIAEIQDVFRTHVVRRYGQYVFAIAVGGQQNVHTAFKVDEEGPTVQRIVAVLAVVAGRIYTIYAVGIDLGTHAICARYFQRFFAPVSLHTAHEGAGTYYIQLPFERSPFSFRIQHFETDFRQVDACVYSPIQHAVFGGNVADDQTRGFCVKSGTYVLRVQVYVAVRHYKGYIPAVYLEVGQGNCALDIPTLKDESKLGRGGKIGHPVAFSYRD